MCAVTKNGLVIHGVGTRPVVAAQGKGIGVVQGNDTCPDIELPVARGYGQRMKNSDQLETHEQPQETSQERKEHLHQVLAKLRDVMLVTFESTGARPVTSARPMHVTRLDDDGTLWFMASHDSRKGEQLKRYSGASVTGQESSRWVSLTGNVDIVTDRAVVRSLWSKGHEIWFPDGPEDPDVALLKFTPEHGEYWDTSGVLGLKYAYEAARALVTGEAARDVKGQHGEVD